MLVLAVAHAGPPDPVAEDPRSVATQGVFDGPTALLSEPARLPRDGITGIGAGMTGGSPGPSGWGAWQGERLSGVALLHVEADAVSVRDREGAASNETGGTTGVRAGFGLGGQRGDHLLGAAAYLDGWWSSQALTGAVTAPSSGWRPAEGDDWGREEGGVAARDHTLLVVAGVGRATGERRPGHALTVGLASAGERADYTVGRGDARDRLAGAPIDPFLVDTNRESGLVGWSYSHERGAVRDPDRRTELWLQGGAARWAEPVTRTVVADAAGTSTSTIDRGREAGPALDVRFGQVRRIRAGEGALRVGVTAGLGGDLLPTIDVVGLEPDDPPDATEAWLTTARAELGLPVAAELPLGAHVFASGALLSGIGHTGTWAFDRQGDVAHTARTSTSLRGTFALELRAGDVRASLLFAGQLGNALSVWPGLWLGWCPEVPR